MFMPLATYTWESIRNLDNTAQLMKIIPQSSFLQQQVIDISHLRTAHYAVFKVLTLHDNYVVRIGISNEQKYIPLNNGFLKTVADITHDQEFEYEIGQYVENWGAHVIRPLYYERLECGVDMMWLPFVEDINAPISTKKWYDALISFHNIPDPGNLPIFNNRQKTMARLLALPSDFSSSKQAQYDELIEKLFQCATRWGVVHGDIHCDNAVNTKADVLLYDLDTLSWGPQVWDLTHLAHRYGQGRNTGYSVELLRTMLGYSEEEFDIAVQLRALASDVAKQARSTQVHLPVPRILL
jgi:hypothetical protein